MKIEFDNLTIVESKMLIDCLVQFRAGQPFAWPAGHWVEASANGQVPTNRVASLVKDEDKPGG